MTFKIVISFRTFSPRSRCICIENSKLKLLGKTKHFC